MSGRFLSLFFVAMLLWIQGGYTRAFSQAFRNDPTTTTKHAEEVLDELLAIPVHRIPKSMLSKAEGIAIIPSVIKVGFVAGVRRGHGVVMTRDADGEWSLPQFITLTGGSVGFQAGVQATDVVLIFKSRSSVNNLMKGKFTIGADAAAAAGPVGRNAAAATDAQLKAEILSYSRSRGLFAGVSLDGSILEIDQAANQAFYGAPSTQVPVRIPESAADLQLHLHELTTEEKPSTSAGTKETKLTTASDEQLEAVQRALQQDAIDLNALLSPEWKKYLAIPAPARPARSADPQAYAAAYQRYARVAANPEYKELTDSPEFQAALALLKEFSEGLSGSPGRFRIPGPPKE